ncbi:MAG: M48 family metallopeptidase [candidate division Zixibacteria bacterium]|nr:M48 family metallopeptidase [candidate division Zixibacteria bacterium]
MTLRSGKLSCPSKYFLILIAIFFLGCAVTGPGGRKSLIFIGTDTEVNIGKSMDNSIRKDNRILSDTLWQKYISEIGQKIVSVCDRNDLQYHFAIVDSNIVNAFATPGGYLYFYSGLLRQMDNEAELAAVVAHEISHVVARHGIKRLQATIGVSLAGQIVFGKNPGVLEQVTNIGLGLTFAGYSRANENEADNLGIQYMTKAGYDPKATLTMFKKLALLSKDNPDFFEKLSMSHPDTQERIRRSETLIDSLQPLSSNLHLFHEKYGIMKSRLH